ncbi:MAG TPA: caspase family protein [Thermoanaerobaculia bacterium]|nr:caspase family protein [Thermoanaerobaculia bacterium]
MLIGINDYSASRIIGPHRPAAPGRDWPTLAGAAEDANTFADMLALLYDFDRRDIVTITDQNATRGAILDALHEHLLAPAQKGDVLFFYFAGHGSQVRNSRSQEADKLDETIVPADSQLGAPDIRDKELRDIFNKILDRGARLTVMLDSCHSGSGARGLPTGAKPRGVRLDPRDVADGSRPSPNPEDRGALVLSAADDADPAWPTRDDDGNFHGVFTWAFLRALRDASAGESAADTFRRAAARMRAETPYQDPKLAGNAEARMNPFLGVRSDRPNDRTVVAVERVRADGTVVLQGGWANGLSLGSELRVMSDRNITVRIAVTALRGIGECEARVTPNGHPLPQAIRSGALMEVVGWAAPPGRPLRVWMPRVSDNAKAIAAVAARMYSEAKNRGVRWISDPIDETPTHVIRRDLTDWQLLGPDGTVTTLGPSSADAIAAVLELQRGHSLFVQFPAPAALVDGIGVGPNTDREGIDPVSRAEDADYILAGRINSMNKLEYTWMRPLVAAARAGERRKCGLPARSDWIVEDGRDDTLRDSAAALREAALGLRRIHGWHLLESPPGSRSPYHLAVRRTRDGRYVDGSIIGDEEYELTLRATGSSLPPRIAPRYIYIFAIDSHGQSSLLFPTRGSVENHLPRATPPPREIRLRDDGAFEVQPPYGVDTYFLLTTDEQLPDPSILEWDGVRTRDVEPHSELEKLLLTTGFAARAPSLVTPSSWSLERKCIESMKPHTYKKRNRVSK